MKIKINKKKLEGIIIAMVLFTAISIVSYHIYLIKNPDIYCQSDINISFNDVSLKSKYNMKVSNGDGVVSLDGKLFAGRVITVKRDVYFKYKKTGDKYIMKSYQIIKSPTDNVDLFDTMSMLPVFFIKTKESKSYTIENYSDAFLIYSSFVPVFYCKK